MALPCAFWDCPRSLHFTLLKFKVPFRKKPKFLDFSHKRTKSAL